MEARLHKTMHARIEYLSAWTAFLLSVLFIAGFIIG
jgi:hypothetical protein